MSASNYQELTLVLLHYNTIFESTKSDSVFTNVMDVLNQAYSAIHSKYGIIPGPRYETVSQMKGEFECKNENEKEQFTIAVLIGKNIVGEAGGEPLHIKGRKIWTLTDEEQTSSPEIINKLFDNWSSYPVIGAVSLKPYRHSHPGLSDTEVCELGTFGVKPELGGQGYASLLLDLIEKHAIERGVKKIFMVVLREHELEPLYNKKGYQTFGTESITAKTDRSDESRNLHSTAANKDFTIAFMSKEVKI